MLGYSLLCEHIHAFHIFSYYNFHATDMCVCISTKMHNWKIINTLCRWTKRNVNVDDILLLVYKFKFSFTTLILYFKILPKDILESFYLADEHASLLWPAISLEEPINVESVSDIGL